MFTKILNVFVGNHGIPIFGVNNKKCVWNHHQVKDCWNKKPIIDMGMIFLTLPVKRDIEQSLVWWVFLRRLQRFTASLFLEKYPPWNKQFAPEHRPSQKETTIPTIHFQVLCLLVFGGCFRKFSHLANCETPLAVDSFLLLVISSLKKNGGASRIPLLKIQASSGQVQK